MRFYSNQHRHTCGVDLHGRNLHLCILDEQGEICLHKKLRCDPELFLEAIAPYRNDLVVGAECIFCWYWLAELFDDPAIQATLRADLSLIDHYDRLIPELESTVLGQARIHDPENFGRLRSVRGVGKILGLTLLYEIGDIARFPSVQTFSSYARLIKCSKESGGKPLGTSGAKIGNVHLKWAFSEAAVCFLEHNPPGQAYLQRLRRKHSKGKALSVLAAKLGRATYFVLKQQTPFDMNRFLAN